MILEENKQIFFFHTWYESTRDKRRRGKEELKQKEKQSRRKGPERGDGRINVRRGRPRTQWKDLRREVQVNLTVGSSSTGFALTTSSLRTKTKNKIIQGNTQDFLPFITGNWERWRRLWTSFTYRRSPSPLEGGKFFDVISFTINRRKKEFCTTDYSVWKDPGKGIPFNLSSQ